MRAPHRSAAAKLKRPGKAAHRSVDAGDLPFFLVPKPGHLPVHLGDLAVQNIDVLLQIFHDLLRGARRAGKANALKERL